MAKRVIVPAILIAVLLLGGYGCMQNNPAQNNQQNTNDAALAYMEQKYGEKFEYVAPWGNSLSGTHQLIVSCSSLPGQEIVVQVENYRQDDRVFRDNYLAVAYRQQSADYFKECAVTVFGKAEVFYSAPANGSSADLPADASLKQFLADTRATHVILIEINEGSYSSESQLEETARLIGKYGTKYFLKIVIVKDEDYGGYDAVSLEDIIGKKEYARCAIIENSTGIVETSWFGE